MKSNTARENAPEKKRKGWAFYIQNLPVVYSHFLIVCCVLFLSIVMLIVNSQISLHTLTERNLSEMQYRLEQNCKSISNTFGAAHSVPSIIQQTRYYSYIKDVDTGYLPDKYAAVVAYLGKTLQIPNYLFSESDECLIYLRGVNSICSKKRVFITAEDCFSQYMNFAETDGGELMDLLKGRDGMHLLPMQEVKIGMAEPKRQLVEIISPSDMDISVLCTYSEEALLRHLEMELLPENTYLQITFNDGTVLEAYPEQITETIQENSYELKAPLPFLKAEATMWIPKTYFSELLAQPRSVSWMIIGATAVIGLALSVILARRSSQPIRELVSLNSSKLPVDRHPNEIRYLSSLIEYSVSEAEAMNMVLFSNVLVRGLSGSVLSEGDVARLRDQLGQEGMIYRVAIFQLPQGLSQPQIVSHLQKQLSSDFYCEPINEREIGLFFISGHGQLEQLKAAVEQLEASRNGRGICGGISGPMENLNHFHIAVRQARVAVMRKTPLNVYASMATAPAAVSWLQHERLYQSILSGDEANSQLILEGIAANIHGSSSREAFYNVRFVLRSAAEELELNLKEWDEEAREYRPNIPAWENMEALKEELHLLFVRMQEKHDQSKSDLQEKILAYLAENYSDCNLCTASVATHFDLSQKSVYTRVRQACGLSFNEYVLSLRMKEAGALLCTTQLRVGEIAERCGFSAESTFYRVFRKYYNVTPNQYRQSGGILPSGGETENTSDSGESL